MILKGIKWVQSKARYAIQNIFMYREEVPWCLLRAFCIRWLICISTLRSSAVFLWTFPSPLFVIPRPQKKEKQARDSRIFRQDRVVRLCYNEKDILSLTENVLSQKITHLLCSYWDRSVIWTTITRRFQVYLLEWPSSLFFIKSKSISRSVYVVYVSHFPSILYQHVTEKRQQ